LSDNSLHSTEIKAAKIELEIDHIIRNAEKTTDQLQKISEIVTRIDFRMSDYMEFKQSTEKRFEKNEQIIHDVLDMVKSQKIMYKGLKWLGGFLITSIISLSSVGVNAYLEMKEIKDFYEKEMRVDK
jgi:hypothetical protein